MNTFYGVISLLHLKDIAFEVADCIGHGANQSAALMLLETCAAETGCGDYRDPTPDGAGRGVGQTDADTFGWLKTKFAQSDVAKRIDSRFGIRLSRVNHDDLDYNPLLSLIFVRLRYLVVPDAIPSTVEGRAAYWKQYYNTSAGKGTVEHYQNNVRKYLTN